MAVDMSNMPLLPMPAVLFPGTFLPVHLTDHAQRALLRECAEQDRPLGVLLNAASAEGGMAPRTTGCIASISLLLDSEEDGPVGAILYGEQRMRVVSFDRQHATVTGRVEILEDYTGANADRRTRQASRLFQRYLALVRKRYQAQVVNVPLPDDPIVASYLLAAVLYLPLEMKQHWLESASAALRLQEELAYLHLECDRMHTLLALSHQTQHTYRAPDYSIFTSLVSQN